MAATELDRVAKLQFPRKRQSLKEQQKRMIKVLEILQKTYPDAHCSLNYGSPFQLLVATILSAQCTDERVNKVTPELFKRFPDAQAMAQARLEDLEELIRSTGFFKNKSISLQRTAQMLVEKYNGTVPQDLNALVQLRGVGRKTANVILGNAYGIPGLVVDTHVGRVSRRLGFTKSHDPVKVEHELMKIVPKEAWTIYSHDLISLGREICRARRPHCERCPVLKYCQRIGLNP